MEKHNRGSFSGRLGYVMAAAGSAVGLGNLWRFPYLAAKYGGGIFLLTYLILALTFGYSMLMLETAIGRKTGQSPIGAFRQLNKKYTFLGVLGTVIPGLIFPYYCVIGGWVAKYLWSFLSEGATAPASDGYFAAFSGAAVQPILWLAVFMGLTFGVVLLGVEKGVEKVSRLMMPALVALTVLIALYTVTRPGAGAGLRYYLMPDFSRFSLMTVVGALGQMFFSLSIAMGILITYGSYMRRDVDMEHSILQVGLFDSGIAFMSGLMIVPSVFVYGGGQAELKAGPSLMFITLPKVFESMPMGRVVGIVFFILVLFAALTSSIALMETVVSSLMDHFRLQRRTACTLTFAASLLISLPSSLGFGVWSHIKVLGMQFLDLFDFISNSLLMPLTALGTCLFAAWVLGLGPLSEEVRLSSRFRGERLFNACIKFIAPVFLTAILVSSILDAFGFLSI